MPAISANSSQKVLVTGANGFIAVWLIRALLERGLSVRGTVRSLAKSAHLTSLFAEYGQKFEVVEVRDFLQKGAFDEAVKGVGAIEHLASPVTMSADDPEDLIGPAVQGTLGILESALKNGSSVKRVVVTSSTAAVLHAALTPQYFTENDWNDAAVKAVQEQGKEAADGLKYDASKTLAEKAAWNFIAEHKGSIGWDLVVLNPAMVFGPTIHEAPSVEQLGFSQGEFYDVLVKGGQSDEYLRETGTSYIDVRDLAEAHILALERQEAGGERIIVVAGPYKWQDWLDAANAITPPVVGLIKGQPGAGKGKTNINNYSTEKMKRVLGLKMRSLDETARDVVLDFQAKGFIPRV